MTAGHHQQFFSFIFFFNKKIKFRKEEGNCILIFYSFLNLFLYYVGHWLSLEAMTFGPAWSWSLPKPIWAHSIKIKKKRLWASWKKERKERALLRKQSCSFLFLFLSFKKWPTIIKNNISLIINLKMKKKTNEN